MRRSKLECHLETIKLESSSPIIIIGGDLNNYDVSPALQEFLDIKEATSPPTRGPHRLDRIFLNVLNDLSKTEAVAPLESPGTQSVGTQSDHQILLASLDVRPRHDFTWIMYRTRDMTVKNLEKFHQQYSEVDWSRNSVTARIPDQ